MTTSSPLPSALARSDAQRRAIRANLGVGILWTFLGGSGGSLLQLYGTQVLGLSAAQIGAAIALLVLPAPLQFFTVGLTERFGKIRVLQVGYLVRFVLLIPFFFLPELAERDSALAYGLLAVLLVGAQAAQDTSFNVAWQPLMRDITTPSDRGRFFGRIRSRIYAARVVFAAVFAVLVGEDMTATHYRIMVVALMVYILYAIQQIGRIPEQRPSRAVARHADGPSLFGRTLVLLRRVEFRSLVVVMCFTCALRVPLVLVFAKRALDITDGQAMLLIALEDVAIISALATWGRLVDRRGASWVIDRTVIGLAVAMLALPVALGVAPGVPAVFSLAAFIAAQAVLNSGLNVALLTESHARVTADDAVLGLAVAGLLVAAMSAAFSAAAGALLGWTLEDGASSSVAYPLSLLPIALVAAAGAWWHHARKARIS